MGQDINRETAAGQPGTKQPGWFRRNFIWFVPLLLVVLGIPGTCCLTSAAGLWGLFGLMNAPRDAAIAAMEADQEIVERLGTPLQPGNGIALNNYQNDNGNGGADLDFNVTGPKGSAHVTGHMKLVAGTWSPEGLTVKFDDGTEITLPRE